MKIIKRLEKPSISIYDDFEKNKLLIFQDPDNLIFVIPDELEITITNELDEKLYYSLSWLLSNEYTFLNNPASSKTENTLTYLSDGSSKIKNQNIREKYSKLIIKKQEDKIIIKGTKNEYLKDSPAVISFNLKNEGYKTINILTGSSLQKDILYSFYLALDDKYLKEKEHYQKTKRLK